MKPSKLEEKLVTWGEVEPIVDRVTTRLVVLGTTRNYMEKAIRSKSVSSTPCLLHLLLPLYFTLSWSEFLLWFLLVDCDSGYVCQINPFLPKLVLTYKSHQTISETYNALSPPSHLMLTVILGKLILDSVTTIRFS